MSPSHWLVLENNICGNVLVIETWNVFILISKSISKYIYIYIYVSVLIYNM